MFKMFGVWSPVIFHNNNLAEKLVGGWTVSPIFNYHTGFPFNPTFGGIGCTQDSNGNNIDVFYAQSGDCNLRPSKYLGGAGDSNKTSAFQAKPGTPGPNFSRGGQAYFAAPGVTYSTPWIGQAPGAPGALPGTPGTARNAFEGPDYSDLDMALTKSFGLPTMKVLGEGGRIEIRANAFNLFNKINLANIDTNITDNSFGRAQNALGARTIEGEFHFKF
jgi:hypothetical protein